jgi:uncharacterized protein (DUF697 family)
VKLELVSQVLHAAGSAAAAKCDQGWRFAAVRSSAQYAHYVAATTGLVLELKLELEGRSVEG